MHPMNTETRESKTVQGNKIIKLKTQQDGKTSVKQKHETLRKNTIEINQNYYNRVLEMPELADTMDIR